MFSSPTKSSPALRPRFRRRSQILKSEGTGSSLGAPRSATAPLLLEPPPSAESLDASSSLMSPSASSASFSVDGSEIELLSSDADVTMREPPFDPRRKSVYALAHESLDLAPPRYRWDFEFADRQLEADYRQDEVKGVLECRAIKLSLLATAIFLGWVVDDAFLSSGSNRLFARFCGSLCAVQLATAACAAAADRYDLPLSWTETALVVSYSATATASVIAFGGGAGVPLFDVPTATGAVLMYQPVLLLQGAVMLSLVAVFAPIRPVLYATMALAPSLTAVAGAAAQHVATYQQRGGGTEHEGLVTLARALTANMSFLALVVVLIVTNAQISRVHRGAYHFYRSVEHGAYERQLRVRDEAEREAAKAARSRLIRMVMHDLRSPLLSVANLAAVLAEAPPSTCLSEPEVVGSLRSLTTCSELMQNIVSDMLDFERIESGRLVLVPAPFFFGQLLDAALASFGGLAKAKGVRLRARPLPDSLVHTAYTGDARRLQQCLNNGISNAIKFTELGGSVTLRADVTHAATGDGPAGPPGAVTPTVALVDALVVEVTDSGCGLSQAELRDINSGEAFTQVGRGQLQGSGGTGLGLSIVRQLVELHGQGSRLEICSDGPGRGTAFRLHLALARAPEGSVPPPVAEQPCAADPASAEPSPPRRKRTPSPLAWPADFRVLHVEDDAMLRRTMLLRVFRPLGVPFDVAEDGAAAVRMIAEEGRAYSVVLLDNQMPRMTGEEAARALRDRGFTGVIVGMTGDPIGCPERNAFEAAGLNACHDKDRAGVSAIGDMLERFALGPASPRRPSQNCDACGAPPAADVGSRSGSDAGSELSGARSSHSSSCNASTAAWLWSLMPASTSAKADADAGVSTRSSGGCTASTEAWLHPLLRVRRHSTD